MFIRFHFSRSKNPRADFSEAEYSNEAQEYASSTAVEYLIEADRHEIIKDDDDQDFKGEDDDQTQESADEQLIEISKSEHEQQSFYPYETTAVNTENVSSMQHDELTFRESYSTETPHMSSELDSWLLGIKETILVITMRNSKLISFI